MKNFLLFAGHAYETGEGGFNDYVGDFETLEDARAEALVMMAREPKWKHFVPDWWHIVDISARKIVENNFGSVPDQG